jgi:hypothetical protein
MPSAQDILDAINNVAGKLDTVHNDLTTVEGKLDDIKVAVYAVRDSVEHVNRTLQWGFSQLITLETYTNQALYVNDEQNDTMICILEHISKNTCELLNEAHTQTGLQKDIKHNTTKLADLYADTHPAAALARHRLEELHEEIEECCPPEPPPPPCSYEPCPKPPEIGKPPSVDPNPPDGRPPP